jgi:hypothetical protein
MDYTAQIQSKLHGHYSGLKKGEGLAWLNASLNQLDQAGLGQLVRAFISGMPDLGKAAGFLLEIQTAQAAIAAYPDAKPSCERKDGAALRPCDITLERSGFRADFQCKSIQNYYNEFDTAKFLHWAAQTYPDIVPARFITLQANTDADEQTFAEFRSWFATNWQSWPEEEEQVWWDSRGKGRVQVSLSAGSGRGMYEGITCSPTQNLRFLQRQDTDHIKKRLFDRIKDARGTFGFSPSASQFNFVVVDRPSLAVTLDEDTMVDALYGDHLAVIDNTGPTRVARAARGTNGLFRCEEIEYCSAVLLMDKFRIDADHDCIVYPHPKHHREVIDTWVGRRGFRLPRGG